MALIWTPHTMNWSHEFRFYGLRDTSPFVFPFGRDSRKDRPYPRRRASGRRKESGREGGGDRDKGKERGLGWARRRERELDRQYGEGAGKAWARVPPHERVPVDRAAPCLLHLL